MVSSNSLGIDTNGRLNINLNISGNFSNLYWLDNDTRVEFAQAAYSVGQAAGTALVSVSRAGKVGSVSVSYATNGGTAVADQDYTSVSGSLTWADDDMAPKTIAVPIKLNPAATNEKTVNITLSNLVNNGGVDVAMLGANSSTVLTIVNNNPGIFEFSQSNTRVDEIAGEAVITVLRQAGSDGIVSVNYGTRDASAVAGSDYTASAGTLTWAAGESTPKTFKVPLVQDQHTELDETIDLLLSAPTGFASLGNLSAAQLIINANTAPNVAPLVKEPIINVKTGVAEPLSINLAPYVYDANGDVLGVSIHVAPQKGAITLGEVGLALEYTPAPGFSGADQFEYTVFDPSQATATGVVKVLIDKPNTPPVAQNITHSGISGQTLRIDLSKEITDQDQDALTISISTPPKNGLATVDQLFVSYQPNAGFSGTDPFEYTVSDGFGGTARATITAIVAALEAEAQGLNIDKVQGADTQTGKLNSPIALAVRVTDDAGQALPGVPVAWNLNGQAEGPPDPVRQIVSPEASFVSQENTTDATGIARATLQTGNSPTVYEVTASASLAALEASDSTTFVIATGLRALTQPDTPEGGLAQALDSLCPKLLSTGDLSAQEQALLERCNEILSASGSGDGQIMSALRALAPEEVATQGRVGNSIATQQLGNIGARLAALRTGMLGPALAGLSFNIKGSTVPGEVLASLLDDTARGGGASSDKPAASRWGTFASGTLGAGSKDETTREDGFDFDTRGLTLGTDYRFSNTLVAGMALGYANTDVNLDRAGGGLDASGWSVSFYGSYYHTDSFYMDGTVNYGQNDYRLTRNIDYTVGATRIQKTAQGNPGSRLLALSLGSGYEIAIPKGWSMELQVRLNYLDTSIEAYSETGADELNLKLSEQSLAVAQSSMGGRLSIPVGFAWGVLIPQLNASWEHEFKNAAHQIKGGFVNDRFNTSFAFKTDEPDRDYFQLALGISAVLPGGRTGFIQYQTSVGRANTAEYSLALGVRLELP